MSLFTEIAKNRQDSNQVVVSWDTKSVHKLIADNNSGQSLKTIDRTIENSGILPPSLDMLEVEGEHCRRCKFKYFLC